MAPSKGCGTCKARKVLCDRTFPKCNRCILAGKECAGYGIRLSWPKPGDPKRSIQGPRPPTQGSSSSQIQLMNVSSWDMEMQDYISAQGVDHNLSLDRRGYGVNRPAIGQHGGAMAFPNVQPLGGPMALALGNLTPQEKDLYQYFVSVASFSLAAFGQNASDIRDVIIRMSLSDGSHSSAAVLKSALALSSVHRYGPQASADRFKISALQALSAATQDVIDKPRSFQHVAAGMLLSSFETQQRSTDTSNHWLWYVCGSKSLIKTTRLDDSTSESDFAALISWVQYYDILARFSLRHWRRNRIGEDLQIQGLGISGSGPTVCGDNQGGRLKSFSHGVLLLLSEVCDAAMERSDPASQTEDYQNYLKVLEWKIRSIPAIDSTIDRNLDYSAWETATVLELYRLTTLIYLIRSTAEADYQAAKLREWIDMAFTILSQLDTCRNPFPILILGFEADNDERRMTMLQLVSRTEEKTHTRTLEPAMAIIQALWAHQDLSDGELEYSKKLHIIFSSSDSVPVLV